MSQQEETDKTADRPEEQAIKRKRYQKPEFRFEQVFETRALACGKVSATQGQCAHNQKTS